MTYDNTNRGALFKNAEKKTDKHPDYSGNLNVGGEEFFLDAWIKERQSGRKFLSVSVKPKQAPLPQKSGRNPLGRPRDDESDIPF